VRCRPPLSRCAPSWPTRRPSGSAPAPWGAGWRPCGTSTVPPDTSRRPGTRRSRRYCQGSVERSARHPSAKRRRPQRVTERRLAPRNVAAIVKQGAARLGFDPSTFGGHSLRAGFVTSAVKRGANLIKITDVTGHKSLEMLKASEGRRCWAPVPVRWSRAPATAQALGPLSAVHLPPPTSTVSVA
jgi:hypothetical protein